VAELDELLLGVEGFQWDAGNSQKNWRRHEISQLECEQIFFDHRLLVTVDLKHSGDEQRFFALGRTDASRGLAVVFTLRGKRIRVISARPMSPSERRQYVGAQANEE